MAGTRGLRDVLYAYDHDVGYNDCARCNREGLDGGIIESWGVGDANVWERNALHDNEGFGGLSLFFADDFSPSLPQRFAAEGGVTASYFQHQPHEARRDTGSASQPTPSASGWASSTASAPTLPLRPPSGGEKGEVLPSPFPLSCPFGVCHGTRRMLGRPAVVSAAVRCESLCLCLCLLTRTFTVWTHH